MVQFCEVRKYEIGVYPEGCSKYFMFYDTISDKPIYFDGEFMFDSEVDFLLWAEGTEDIERYTSKIPHELRSIHEPKKD